MNFLKFQLWIPEVLKSNIPYSIEYFMEDFPEVKLRVRISAHDVHYAGDLVDGHISCSYLEMLQLN